MIEVEKLLQEKGVEYKLIKLSRKVISHEDVKKYSKGTDPEDDCKVIMTKDKQGNQYAFFARGMMKLDFSKIKEIVGKKLNIMNYEELKKSTGKEPGAVCPLLLKNTKIYVDKRVLQRNKIDFSSGEQMLGLQIFTKDLNKIMDFETVDIAEE